MGVQGLGFFFFSIKSLFFNPADQWDVAGYLNKAWKFLTSIP